MPTTQEKVNIWYGANGSEAEERQYPEAGSQTFKRGDLVYLVSGQVTAAAAVGANPTNQLVLGIALCDATKTTGSPIPVAIANPNLRWVLPAYAASNPAVNAVTAIGDVGSKFELNRAAAGKWGVDRLNNTYAKVVVTAIHPAYAAGEEYGWVEVKFIDAQVSIDGGS